MIVLTLERNLSSCFQHLMLRKCCPDNKVIVILTHGLNDRVQCTKGYALFLKKCLRCKGVKAQTIEYVETCAEVQSEQIMVYTWRGVIRDVCLMLTISSQLLARIKIILQTNNHRLWLNVLKYTPHYNIPRDVSWYRTRMSTPYRPLQEQ